MPGADRTRLVIILAWGAAFIAGLSISPFAPAVLVALLIPAAGALVWLAHSAEERSAIEKLRELSSLIEDPDEDEQHQAAPESEDPFAQIRDRIARRNRWLP